MAPDKKTNWFINVMDWWNKNPSSSKVNILLFAIIFFLGYNYFQTHQETFKKLETCEILKTELTALKERVIKYEAQLLLVKSSSDYNPNAMWLTDRKGIILWINKAYETKYLLRLGYTAIDLIGTDGQHIFTKEVIEKFNENNRLVLFKNKPITFKELIPTTKFPVKVGNYVYAIGGMEYEVFND
ncbi:MAG: hypothetical protein ACPG6B_01410 [Oceanihabitans sp.]